MTQTRSSWLRTGAALAAAAALPAVPRRALAQATPLDVAYAGSMTSLMEGPVKAAAERRLGIAFQGRAQGSNALANLIASGGLRPDVFVSVTASPIRTVLAAGKAKTAVPVARTSMVIAYSPRSSIAAQLAAAGKRGAAPWWRVLETPGTRFGRTDPATDPQGRNIIFVMQLAGAYYGQPDLAQRILGPDQNPVQIFEEPTVEARLQSGELDAAAAYRLQPAAFGLPYVALPAQIDLSDDRRHADYEKATLTLSGKTYHPEPLVYYAAILNDAAHPQQAAAFVAFLAGREGQALFHQANYDPVGNAAPLRA